MRPLSDDRVRSLRLRAQQLDQQHHRGVAPVLKELCGVQAQDARAAALAVRARSSGLVATDIEYARVQERSVVRTWAMRGTLHLVATEDLDWLLSLLGPVLVRQSQRRYTELGLDEDTGARGIRALRHVLTENRPLTRADIVDRLAAGGIHLEGQGVPHLVRYAALQGLVCLGPDRDGEPTYVLLEQWVDLRPALEREVALAELARRYLAAYGPAGPDDLAVWSGLSLGEVRAGWRRIAGDLMEVEAAGRPAWMPKTRVEWLDDPGMRVPVVRLLPSFDTYLLGYRKRDLAVAPEHAKRVHPGGGVLHPTLLVDGRALGTWRSQWRRDRLEVAVEPFEPLAPNLQPGLEAEVADIGRFFELNATLNVTVPASPKARP